MCLVLGAEVTKLHVSLRQLSVSFWGKDVKSHTHTYTHKVTFSVAVTRCNPIITCFLYNASKKTSR